MLFSVVLARARGLWSSAQETWPNASLLMGGGRNAHCLMCSLTSLPLGMWSIDWIKSRLCLAVWVALHKLLFFPLGIMLSKFILGERAKTLFNICSGWGRNWGIPWPYSAQVPDPNPYMFQKWDFCPKYRFTTTYWLSLDDNAYRPLTCGAEVERSVLKQFYQERFAPVTELCLSNDVFKILCSGEVDAVSIWWVLVYLVRLKLLIHTFRKALLRAPANGKLSNSFSDENLGA